MTRSELVEFCLAFPAVYEDYPFDTVADSGAWTVMRHRAGKRSFALIYERNGRLCVNLKCEPLEAELLRQAFADVIPAYHMNKTHWNTVVLGGDVPVDELLRQMRSSYSLTKPSRAKKSRQGGQQDMIRFGPYDWRILQEKDGQALVLSDKVIGKRAYDDGRIAITWEACGLRRYLNGEFHDRFSTGDRARIMDTTIKNDANPWFGTDGGNDTTDRIFLLSIEEAVSYWGDSGQLKNRNPGSKLFINDRYKSARKARDMDGASAWWWLRSPGLRPTLAAQVYNGGAIHISGHHAANCLGGVRPALWLRL